MAKLQNAAGHGGTGPAETMAKLTDLSESDIVIDMSLTWRDGQAILSGSLGCRSQGSHSHGEMDRPYYQEVWTADDEAVTHMGSWTGHTIRKSGQQMTRQSLTWGDGQAILSESLDSR